MKFYLRQLIPTKTLLLDITGIDILFFEVLLLSPHKKKNSELKRIQQSEKLKAL